MTKNCVWPWTYVLIHAGGLMQTCPCASDLEIGDFILDVCEAKERFDAQAIFSNEALRKIRDGLLTGNLRKMCQNCAFASPELVTTTELRQRVEGLLQKRYGKASFSEEELRSYHAYDRACFSLTNRCQLRCIYCNQSTCADTNPFYRASFPEDYVEGALDMLAGLGISMLQCSTEGEATISPLWYTTFSRFMEKYPHINLHLTTNLNRRYSEAEIEFLAQHYGLDVSCDTLDETLYKKIRVNGNLPLLLENLSRITAKRDALGLPRSGVLLHTVVCNLTWTSLEALSEFAFAHGYVLNLGNYEERGNALGHQSGELKSIFSLSQAEQVEIHSILRGIEEKAEKMNLRPLAFGDITRRVERVAERNFHRFSLFDDNPVHASYYGTFPKGTEHHHFSVVYDADNTAHFGIIAQEDMVLPIDNIQCETIVWREIAVYKNGKGSPKASDYQKNVTLGYRRKVRLENGRFLWKPEKHNSDIAAILLEITGWR